MNKYQAKLLSLLAIHVLLHASPSMATVVTYEYVMEYQSEAFWGAEAYEQSTYYDPYEEKPATRWETLYSYNGYEPLRGEDNVYGFQGPLTDTAAGTQFTLSLSIDLDGRYAANGLFEAPLCTFGTFNCRGGSLWETAGEDERVDYNTVTGMYSGGYNGYALADVSFDGLTTPGEEIEMRLAYVEGRSSDQIDRSGPNPRSGYYIDYSAYFSFVEARLPDCAEITPHLNLNAGAEIPACTRAEQVASVPLSGSLLFLAAGLLGLAGVSARRRPT